MSDTITLQVGGMTCGGCASNVTNALVGVGGVTSAVVSHGEGTAVVTSDSNLGRNTLEQAVIAAGYTVKAEDGSQVEMEFNWGDKAVWKQSANNTKWCLLGCSIGEFGTLAAYSIFGIGAKVAIGTNLYYFLLILPLINGLITSIMLETIILMRTQMDFSNALKTAFGMSFIAMLMMEISMEITDLLFTGGELGMNFYAIPLMLLVGFLTPWPYNYWRLKALGQACH